MSSEKPTIKLSIKPHRFNNNGDCKKIKKEVKRRLDYSISLGDIKNICNTFFGSYYQKKLLEEGEFIFLSKIGKHNIYKEYVFDNKNLVGLIKAGHRVQSHNRTNYLYPIVFTKGEGVAKEIKFVPSKKVKDKLKEILNTTTKDYKPKPIKTTK